MPSSSQVVITSPGRAKDVGPRLPSLPPISHSYSSRIHSMSQKLLHSPTQLPKMTCGHPETATLKWAQTTTMPSKALPTSCNTRLPFQPPIYLYRVPPPTPMHPRPNRTPKQNDPIPISRTQPGKTHTHHVKTPIHRGKTPIHRGKTPIHHVKTPIHRRKAPIHRGKTPIHRGKTRILIRSPNNHRRVKMMYPIK